MRIKLFRVIAMLIATFTFTVTFAQRIITGTITDEKSAPLAGATINVKGSKILTISDASGKFSISAPASARILTISYVGMDSKDVTIGTQNTISVSLNPTS